MDERRAVFRLKTEERHRNPMGTTHGGVLCDLAGAAMGCAFATSIRPGESYTTLELSINFLKPVWSTTLTATGWRLAPGPARHARLVPGRVRGGL